MNKPTVEQLVTELKALRRGYGVQARDIATRIGPILRHTGGLTENDSQPAQRAKVIAILTDVIDELPSNLASMAITVFGLTDTADVRFEERMARLADAMDRDVRTARRHVDDLLIRIAETALDSGRRWEAPTPEIVHPWRTVELTTVVLLDLPVAEVIEERRIVSRSTGLTSIDYALTITEDEPLDLVALGITVLRGAVLHSPERVGSNRLNLQLRLPVRLPQTKNM